MKQSDFNCFTQPSYVVLDIPQPVAAEIRTLRRFFDIDRARLSIEISLASSNGLGIIATEQDPQKVFHEIDRIAAETAPFRASFGKVEKFPETGIFYYTLQNEEPFYKLHEQLAASEIEFIASPHPYVPHCTLKLAASAAFSEEEILSKIQPPKEEFTINKMMVCSIVGANINPKILHSAQLQCEI